MRLLVTGSAGVLGQAVLQAASSRSLPDVIASEHGRGPHALELRDPASVARTIDAARPDVVLHLAAITNTRRAEEHPAEAMLVNRDGTAAVATACAHVGARLIALSTDLVFPGREGGLYREDDLPQPLSVYGASKLAAEGVALAACANTVVVRTSLILSPGRGHIAALARAITGGTATLFTDEIRSPILASDLAEALLDLAACNHVGILHVAGPDRLSRWDLGVAIAHRLGLDASRLRPASRLDAPPPPRPGDVSLSSAVAHGILGRTPSPP